MQEILLQPIGVARTPHRTTADVPRGLGTKHVAEGTIELRRMTHRFVDG